MLLLTTSPALPRQVEATCPKCGERSSFVMPPNAQRALVECTAKSPQAEYCGTMLVVTREVVYNAKRVGHDVSSVVKPKEVASW